MYFGNALGGTDIKDTRRENLSPGVWRFTVTTQGYGKLRLRLKYLDPGTLYEKASWNELYGRVTIAGGATYTFDLKIPEVRMGSNVPMERTTVEFICTRKLGTQQVVFEIVGAPVS